MSEAIVTGSAIGFLEITSKGTPVGTNDGTILGSYLGILANYLTEQPPTASNGPLAVIAKLPALIQVASQQRTSNSQPSSVTVSTLAQDLSGVIGLLLQRSLDPSGLADLSRSIASTMLQQLLATTGGSTDRQLIVLDSSNTDSPRIGVLDCSVTIVVQPAPKDNPFKRPTTTVTIDGSWTAFLLNGAQASDAQSVIDSLRSTHQVLALRAIPGLLHITTA